MVITCQKCGKTGEGQLYKFHYGELYNTQSSNLGLGVATVTTQTKTYRIFGEEGAYICDLCATSRLGWKGTLGLFFFGLAWAFFGTLIFTGNFTLKVGWQTVLFCICPGAFLVLLSFIGVFELFGKVAIKADADTGEMAAIEARRNDLSVGHSASEMVFWTSKEYKKLVEKRRK
jgi:hypothetical protein